MGILLRLPSPPVTNQKPPPPANNQDKDTTVVDNPQVRSTPKPDSPSLSYRVANTLISHKPTLGQKTIRLSPDGQKVMKDNYLTEALLKTHLGHISHQLSNKGETRLFLTGFGTFGGTSLVRATTFKLMERLKKSQEARALVIRFDTSNHSDLHEYQLVVNENDNDVLIHLTYKARGSTARLMRELKKDYLTHDGQQMVMNLEEIYERKHEEIEHNVDMLRLLDRNWAKIIGKKRFKSTETKDRAKIGVYNVVEWIRDQQEPFDRAGLSAAARRKITISDSEYVREKILGHLLRLLVEHDYLRYDTQTDHYELADDDHWHDIDDVDEADEVDEVDDASLHVAIVGDVTVQEENVNTLLTQIAFELVQAGNRLVTADCLPISALIRLQLVYYVLLHEYQVPSEQKPLLLIETRKNEVTDYDSEEVKSATDERHALEILLEEADVVVFAQRERAHDSVFAWQKVKLEAKKQEVAIIPVGAIGGASAHVWDEVDKHLADYYRNRIEREIFTKIGPSQTYVPDVARAVVGMVELLAE